jgi:hypothetical protein
MSHHSSEMPLEELERIRRAVQLGATGRFPDGKVVEHDEGEIRFAVASDPKHQKVFIEFGKSIRSLGMTAEQASDLGKLLIDKSLESRGIT